MQDHSIYVTHNIMDITIIKPGIKHHIATGLGTLYKSCGPIKSDLSRSMWICLDNIMILLGSRTVQYGECNNISAYTEHLCLSPVHQIVVAATKYDQLLSPGV